MRATPVVSALFQHYQRRSTGRLIVVLPEGGQAEVRLQAGHPVALDGSVEDARRGAWLRRLAKMSIIDEGMARQVLSKGRIPWPEALAVLPDEARPSALSLLTLWRLEALATYTRCQVGFQPDEQRRDGEMSLGVHPLSLFALVLPAVSLPDDDRVFFPAERAGLSELPSAWASLAEVAARAHGGARRQMEAACRTLGLTPQQASTHLMVLCWAGHLTFGFPPAVAQAPAAPVERKPLAEQDFFTRLDVPRETTAGAVRAAHTSKVHAMAPDDPERALYDEAMKALVDDERRAIIGEALDLGEDPSDKKVIDRLTARHVAAEGRRLQESGDYKAAANAFGRLVKLMPDDPMAHVNFAWSAFLGSERTEEAAKKAGKLMRRAMEAAPDMDAPLLYMGKIYRLAGMSSRAEAALKSALELNPRNPEARSELRLVASRAKKGGGKKGGGKRPGAKTTGPQRAVTSPRKRAPAHDASLLTPTLATFFGVLLLLFVAANLLPGGSVNHPISGEPWPDELQRLGNSEYFYVFGDIWWWARRLVLAVAGVLGLRWLAGKGHTPAILGEQHLWLVGALVYGGVVGFFSPIQQLAGGGAVLLMTFVHVAAEQLFFIGFIHTALSRALKRPELAVVVTGLLFGLYHLSYMSILAGGALQILVEVVQIAGFAGMAYAALAWRYQAVGAAFLAHLVVNMTMMFLSLSAQGV